MTRLRQALASVPKAGWFLAGAALLAAIVVVGWQNKEPLTEALGIGRERLRCEPEAGTLTAYRIRMHTQIKVNASALLTDPKGQQPGQLLSSDAGFSARLRFRAVEPRKGGMFVAFALDDIEANAGMIDLPKDMREQLEKPFYAMLAPDCRFTEFAFRKDVSDDVVNRTQALVQGLSLALDQDTRKATWLSREHDPVGQYSARYTRSDTDPRRLVKARQSYLRSHRPAGFAIKEPMLVRVIDSKAPVTLDEDHAWLSHFESREHVQIVRASGGMIADLKSTMWLEQTSEDVETIALARTDADLRWRKPAEPPLVTAPTKPEPPEAMKTMPLEIAMAEYTSIMRSGAQGAIAKAADYLALYLRARPEMAFELIRLLERNQVPPDLESTLYLGLELAGTPEALAALTEGLSDAHAPRNRARAAAALPDVPRPTQQTLEALVDTARNAKAQTPDDARLVRNAAGYAIGTLEQRTRVANPALARAALAELRSGLSSAQGHAQQAAALDAIGNSGNAALLPDVQPLLAAEEGLVRAHAIQAMQHMDPKANQDMFKGLIAREPDAQIRGTIAVTYADQAKRANQPPPAPVVTAAIEQLSQESDPRVRGLLIELIGPAAASSSSAVAALAAQFHKETDPILLRLIGKYVPGNRLGP